MNFDVNTGRPYYTIIQAARKLMVTEHRIRMLIQEGKLGSELVQRKRRIYPIHIMELEKNHGLPNKKLDVGGKYA